VVWWPLVGDYQQNEWRWHPVVLWPWLDWAEEGKGLSSTEHRGKREENDGKIKWKRGQAVQISEEGGCWIIF